MQGGVSEPGFESQPNRRTVMLSLPKQATLSRISECAEARL
jgi:hypothetical protein